MISDCDICMIDDFSLLKTAIATDYYFKIIKKKNPYLANFSDLPDRFLYLSIF